MASMHFYQSLAPFGYKVHSTIVNLTTAIISLVQIGLYVFDKIFNKNHKAKVFLPQEKQCFQRSLF
eukprot:c55969_g1_i1 orf=3-197(-)